MWKFQCWVHEREGSRDFPAFESSPSVPGWPSVRFLRRSFSCRAHICLHVAVTNEPESPVLIRNCTVCSKLGFTNLRQKSPTYTTCAFAPCGSHTTTRCSFILVCGTWFWIPGIIIKEQRPLFCLIFWWSLGIQTCCWFASVSCLEICSGPSLVGNVARNEARGALLCPRRKWICLFSNWDHAINRSRLVGVLLWHTLAGNLCEFQTSSILLSYLKVWSNGFPLRITNSNSSAEENEHAVFNLYFGGTS